MLGRADGLDSHPIRKLYDAGARMTVNTDDVLVFGRDVSEELISLYRVGLFSVITGCSSRCFPEILCVPPVE